ncbi:MAG: HAD-IC family P-type ATPase, partial [candidate division Zixibacteria bacterium]|nr:HAD-IC family P-type ATPase [candidate division Zixibacteria bacterium]
MLIENKNIEGLTSKQVQDQLDKDGYNELPSQKKRGFLAILLEVVKEPMLLLLVCAGAIYFFLGERQDALMLSSFVVFIVGITFYQQRKTERALEALRDLSSPRALVIRDGVRKRIAGREVVVGDIMVLQEGDRVAADAALLESVNLMVDESLLTGESLAVTKSVWDGKRLIDEEHPGGDNLAFVYSGTLVTRGHGLAKVLSVGLNTKMGKIGKSLQVIGDEETLLKKETGRLVKIFSSIGFVLCLVTVALFYFFKGNLLQGVLYGLTISMSMLPEEFPVVLLIFLTIGAWRISKHKVLTRNTAAIETLGAANILCVDKTGTLTLNQMRLRTLVVAGGGMLDLAQHNDQNLLPEEYEELLEYSILASQADPFDPLDKEIKKTGEFLLRSTNHLHSNWKLIKEYPFSENLLALSHVWELGDGGRYVVAAKGAPESIADLCHLKEDEKKKLTAQMEPLFSRGLRLIGVAVAAVAKDKLRDYGQHDFDFEFVGLLGFEDPVRPSVPAAV